MLTVEALIETAAPCSCCKGSGVERRDRSVDTKYANSHTTFNCPACHGSGLAERPGFGSLTDDGVSFRPGSREKVKAMAARYASGLPLWHENDAKDQECQDLGEPSDDLVAPLLSIEFDDDEV